MADVKITDLPEVTEVADDDQVLLIDVSDNTAGPNGTDKRSVLARLVDLLFKYDVETAAELEASNPIITGRRAICRERAHANYILADEGYTALPGDIVAANGRVWAFQIDSKGMDILSFGSSFDLAISNAVLRCSGVCDILVKGAHTTSGNAFNSVSDVYIKGVATASLFLANLSNAPILSFTNSTNINIENLDMDGNRANQTATTTANDTGAGLFFEFCDGIHLKNFELVSPSGATVRARNCQNVFIDGLNGNDGGYIPYYIGPNALGSAMYNIEVKNCYYDWSTVDRAISERGTIAIGTNEFPCYNVNIENNTLFQSSDSPSAFHASIGLRECINSTVIGNRVHNGGIPITIVQGCDNVSIANNTIDTETTLYAIEIAGGMTNWTVTGNTCKSATSMNKGLQVNGGSSYGTVTGNNFADCAFGCVIVGPNSTTLSSNIAFSDNNINCTESGYSFKFAEKISVSGGVIDNAGATSDISMEDCRKIMADGLNVESAATFFMRIAGTTITHTDTLASSNKVRDLAYDRYIRDTTSGAGLGARVRYQGESLTIHDLQTFTLDATDSGNPEGSVTAGVGSTFRRTDGGASTTFYVKETGAGNTGWVAK